MLLKMLTSVEFAVQESNQIIKYVGNETLTCPMTDNAIDIYGDCKVVNIYPRTDGVYGVMFEIEEV